MFWKLFNVPKSQKQNKFSDGFQWADESADPRVIQQLSGGSPFFPNNSILGAYPGLGMGTQLDPQPNVEPQGSYNTSATIPSASVMSKKPEVIDSGNFAWMDDCDCIKSKGASLASSKSLEKFIDIAVKGKNKPAFVGFKE